MAMKLQLFHGPVTSLVVCSNKVIAGCGSEISIYNLSTKKLESRHHVFTGAAVHGLRKGPYEDGRQLLCLFGEKKVRVAAVTNCTSDTVHSHVTFLCPSVQVEDWIWDAKWLNSDHTGQDTIALALAHNCVLHWDWRQQCIIGRRFCAEKCILYTAHFIGDTWTNVVLAAGTVFNQVVLWPVMGGNSDTVDVMYALKGHQGVIFSICYREDLEKIASASDDRSIRVWHLKLPSGTSREEWEEMKSDLLFCVYGHSARVWKVVLLADCLASVGEDAMAIVWDYEGKVKQRFKGHKGRSIWSMTVTEDEKCLVTGGGDASIRVWDIQNSSLAQNTSESKLDIPESVTQNGSDFPRSVCLVSCDRLLIMMNSGTLVQYSIQENSYNIVFSDPNFHSYSVVTVSPDQTIVAVGSIGGQLRLVKLADPSSHQDDQVVVTEQTLFSGKVLSLCWINGHKLLVSGPNGRMHLLTVRSHKDTLISTTDLDLHLPKSKHRWVTATCLYTFHGDILTYDLLVCGDKDGSVHCYRIDKRSEGMRERIAVQPCQSFHRVHGKAGVTSVCQHDNFLYTTGRDGCYKQWTVTGHGQLEMLHSTKVLKGFDWLVSLQWQGDDLLVLGFCSSQFVIWSTGYNQQLLTVQCGGGHRSWDCQGLESLQFVYLKSGTIYLTQRSSLDHQTILQTPLHGRELCDAKILQTMAQDTERPSLLVCTVSEDTSVNVGLIQSHKNVCTWVCLACLRGHLSSVRTVAFIKVPSMHCGDSNFLLFTAGGRAEIRVWSVTVTETDTLTDRWTDTDTLTDRQTDTDTLTDRLTDTDTLTDRLTDTDRQSDRHPVCTYKHLTTYFLGESRHKHSKRSWKSHKLRLDPETRVMCVAVTEQRELICESEQTDKSNGTDQQTHCATDRLDPVCVVSLAGSDGVLRTFAYNQTSHSFTPLLQSTHHAGCILKVHHHIHTQSGGGRIPLLFSASTNGQIVVWSLQQVIAAMVKKGHRVRHEQTSGGFGHNVTGQRLDSGQIEGDKNDNGDGRDDEDDVDEEEYTDFSCSPVREVEEWSPLTSFSAHQSGVNSLYTLQISGSQLMVASGGDDNAVTVQVLELTQNGEVIVKSSYTKTDAHAAQVTGIWLLSSTILVSASIDQRVCVWSVDLRQTGHQQIQMVSCTYVSVSDVSSLDVFMIRDCVYLLVAGEGLCLYHMNRTEER